MCGFVGIFDIIATRPTDEPLLRRMNAALAHRGPDGEGYHIAPGIGLGHRRLAIIDLVSGQQPIYNEDKTVLVVFNGEIYNYKEIRRELEAKGHTFRTESDTEVIVHAWEEWAGDSIARLWGMFAFALWDQREEVLLLARDRLGKKPLYYSQLSDGTLIFGSELKALLQHPELPRKLDPISIADYCTFGYVPDPRSIFAAVRKVEPAHYMLWRRDREPSFNEYWRPTIGGREDSYGENPEEELIELIRAAVETRMNADVPLGAFLSGGVDSGAVVSQMAGISAQPISTFTISVNDSSFDESRYAQQVADLHSTDHRVRDVNATSFELIGKLGEVFDEPFADSSALPTYLVSSFARQHVKVALSGDGGDELFAGYRRYRWHLVEERIRQALPRALRRTLFGALASCYPKMDWAPQILRAQTTFKELAMDSLQGYLNNVAIIDEKGRDRIFSAEFRRDLQGYSSIEVLNRHLRTSETDDPLLQAQYIDIKTYLSGDILTKVDRASMANSLEVRTPLLDHRLVEWSFRLPRRMKIRGTQGKWLLKRALEPHLPHDVLYRPKQGFSIPVSSWCRGALSQQIRDAILKDHMRDSGYFDMDGVLRLLNEHQSGQRDHGATLWSLLVFSNFLETTVEPADQRRVA